MLVVNQARSITENLVQMGVRKCPQSLIRGLAIAQKELEDIHKKMKKITAEAIDRDGL